MAEIISNDNTSTPQSNYEGWTKAVSKNGQTFHYKSADKQDTTNQPAQSTDVNDSPFRGLPLDWTVDSSGEGPPPFLKHMITKGSSPETYRCTFESAETYNFTFHIADGDLYRVNYYVAGALYYFDYSSTDPTILTADGE